MSTTIRRPLRRNPVSHPASPFAELDRDPSLFHPRQLVRRLALLDELDAAFGDISALPSSAHPPAIRRAAALRDRLEAANAEICQSVRSRIRSRGHSSALQQWLQPSAAERKAGRPFPGLGFDARDDIVSAVLPLREPRESPFAPAPEMAPWQPTPVRHILDCIALTRPSASDLLVDLGSGLGHVPMLVSILTGIPTLGIERQPDFVASAQECARSLGLGAVRFIAADARHADLSAGTLFYLYSPFRGSLLSEVLRALQKQSVARPITIASLGPCTRNLAREDWLQPSVTPDPERITVFVSR